MATERTIPCEYYLCEGSCARGREGSFHHSCQKCTMYSPRANEGKIAKTRRENKKKYKERKHDYDYNFYE